MSGAGRPLRLPDRRAFFATPRVRRLRARVPHA